MHFRPSLFAAAVLLSGWPALAAEVEVPAPQGGTHLTIYSGDFALVRDRRAVRLPAVNAELAFTGVSRQLQPETALLEVLDGELKVGAQSFNFDVLTPQRLMEQSVGREVGVVITNPATGEETVERARLLSVTDGLVIEMNGKIHTGAPGRIVFDELPAGVRARPTLLMSVKGKAGQEIKADLSYLTSGLSWRADYVAQYDPDAGRMDLKAWATVTNTTGMDFKDARLKLVAGDVNRESVAPEQRMMRTMEVTASRSPMADGVSQQDLVAYHMYTLPGATTLNDRESKQLALLGAEGIAVARALVSRSRPHLFTTPMRGQTQESQAEVSLTFQNDKAASLGAPLPAGTMRVYTMDADGAPQLLGEDGIDHTAEGDEVTVALGRDFDVSVLREQTNFVRASDNITLTNWRLTVSNAKPRAVSVRLIEQLPGSWEITKESAPHTKLNAAEAEWTLEVPAKGKATLEYNVRTRF